MEAIRTLLGKLQDTVAPISGTIRPPNHDHDHDHDRISLLTVHDDVEPYHDDVSDSSSNFQDGGPRTPEEIQFTPQQLYSYLPLNPSAKSIRVLDIDPAPSSPGSDAAPLSGTLRIVHLSEFPAFTALSYTWGPYSSPVVDTIRCNGSCNIPITKNGRDALLALRKRHYVRSWGRSACPLTIWVDAVCINQADDTEKAGQIALMAEVYTWARTVWVWLGQGNERTTRAVQTLKQAAGLRIEPIGVPWIEEHMYAAGGSPRSMVYYKAQLAKSMVLVFLRTYWRYLLGMPRYLFSACGGTGKGGLPLGSGSSEDIACLLDREWMERAWTFQEVVLASNPVIVCGDEAISWAQLQQGLDCLDQMKPSFAGSSTGGGPAGLRTMRYYLFEGWTKMSKDIRNMSELEGEWENCVQASLRKTSVISQRWASLFQVWRTVSRPTGWNGRAFRSAPKLDTNGSEQQNGGNNNTRNPGSPNFSSVDEYEGQFGIRKLWTILRLVVLAPYVGFILSLFCAIAIAGSSPLRSEDPFEDDPFGDDPVGDGHFKTIKFHFVMFGIAALLLVFNFVPFIIYVSLAIGYPTIGSHDARPEVDAASGLVAIAQVLRNRKAQEAHDKSFATHGVLERLGVMVPPPDYGKMLGKVYHELYVELVKREPSYIALLCDVKGAVLPGAPSWVPNWGSEKLHWVREDALYSRIEDLSRPGSPDLVKWVSDTEIVVRGLFVGEISYASRPIGCGEQINGIESVWRDSLGTVDEWRREVVKLCGRQTYRCDYRPSVMSMVLRPLHQSSPEEWIEEDFGRWHKILAASGYDNASRYELIDLALSDWEFQARRFTEYICRVYAGTASLFISDDGFVGKGPRGVERGDQICLIDGVGQPMILRKTGDSGKYRVVGPAFACHLQNLHTFEDGDRGVVDRNRWGPVTLV
ncbi:heterokaryon incompatibility protein-domain-containing protein [Sordaria brevicollis]|uniref:Heterokaryon incompatibility protein-domain-containing protein n=1 Tax=Sordaria brevicollis TaxID=83679 RepID=A0AAE0PJH3_SORBR|nr:heterokaryon incompatibility protein-domain-containing protein [Sordaria brevicollis]